MDEQSLKNLLVKYREEQCTPEERAWVESWYLSLHSDADPLGAERLEMATDRVRQRLEQTTRPVRKLGSWLPYVAASVLVLVIGIWLAGDKWLDSGKQIATVEVSDVAPPGNRARLTLSGGGTIDLSATQSQIIVSNGKITYPDGSSIADEAVVAQQYELYTPRGGTYRVTLPDGTQVWLNAESKLRYPSQFGASKRVVEFDGEGYFSVTKDKDRPFIVISNRQEIQVLGTTFNISSYADESITKTTLVEGSVRVLSKVNKSSSLILSPGEQSKVSGNGKLMKARVDMKKELAWRSGLFYFDHTSLEELMRQIGRWYDVDIHYKDSIPQGSFSGVMDRNVSLRTLLGFLDESGLEFKFKLEGRTLNISGSQ